MKQRFQLIVVLTVLALATAQPGYAYLDPGTGSYVVQVVLASVLGVGFAVKTYWANLKGFVLSLFTRKQHD